MLAVEVPSSLLHEYCAGLHLRGDGGACSRRSCIAGGMVASCSTWSISGHRSQTSFLGDSLCSLLAASEAGGPGGSRAVGPGEEKVAHVAGTCVWERGGHLLLAGSGQLPRQRETGRRPSSYLLGLSEWYMSNLPSRGLGRGRAGFPAQQTGWEIMIPFL